MANVTEIAQINFARGKVGKRNKLIDDQQKQDFKNGLIESTKPLTITNTADCGDERLTVALANGADFDNRIVPQLFGGLGLALTKAMVAANAAAVKDAKNMWQAFMEVDNLLRQFGYENAGHEDCGASKAVESSVANQIDIEALLPAVNLFISDQGQNHIVLSQLEVAKKHRLEAGFYSDWKPAELQNYLVDKYPQNFSYLKVDDTDHETHGHNGSGLYVITRDGDGFQKNGRAFSLTLPFMRHVARKFGGSELERRDILMGLVDDNLHVGAGLVAVGFPVFAQVA